MGAFLFIPMRQNPAITAFKVWIFPSLVSLLGLMIWHDVNEVKADVKQLMAQSNIDKTRIDNLEREVYEHHNKTASFPIETTPTANTYAILPDNKLIVKWLSKSL
jgi:hypothetical protein